jgi:hypothetical protein
MRTVKCVFMEYIFSLRFPLTIIIRRRSDLSNPSLHGLAPPSGYSLTSVCRTASSRPLYHSIVKVKQSVPQHTYEGARGERRHSSYSFMTSALDAGEWLASRPGSVLPRGKEPRYPLDRRPRFEPPSPDRPVRS